ncbi:MAG: hypothetical protein KJN89_03330 [Gammaproteobacteria bacterium]|nr:hypothetical protein [Gammaproteobacteria bacterium]NNJ49383.1 hypothetical protein [Gammaproteobacteria bacterium]
MILNDRQIYRSRQNGVALLVLAILIAFTVTAYYFSNISLLQVELENDKQTRTALAKARQALLSYAVTHWQSNDRLSLIGQLPCPDSNNATPEGEQNAPCGAAYANAIGYFPWRTLNIDALYSGDGECLLYAVSPAYKSAPVAAINPDSFGQFQIVDSAGAVVLGNIPEDRPVAIIFAAGKALGGQARNHVNNSLCGLDYGNIAAYLDDDGTTDNAAIDIAVNNVIDRFVHKYDGSEQGANPLNDSLVTVTHEDLWQVLDSSITSADFNIAMKNLTEAVAMCFAAYGLNNIDNNLPMPAALDLNGGEYRRNTDYDDSANFTTAFAGRLPYNVSSANAVSGVVGTPNIYSNAFCDAIDLPSTIAINENINFSNDAGSDNGEYFDLWQNWKDHFFYAVSNRFKPDGGGSAAACDPGGSDCVDVSGTKYAAIIFFSGLKQVGQSRYAPPFEADEKNVISNYLENGNPADFPDNSGTGDYDIVGGASNDVMFCIREDMSVVECL